MLKRELKALSKQLKGELDARASTRLFFSSDASVYQVEPIAVAFPKESEDLVKILHLCRSHGIPLTMRGGGTSLAGQAVGEGILVDTSLYYRQILKVDLVEEIAWVEPGVVLGDLNRSLEGTGLYFAPDPATAEHACIGGVLGNNSSGAHSLLWGKSVDHVCELEVVLVDGTRLELGYLNREQLKEKMARSDREGELYRGVVNLILNNAHLIEKKFSKILRRVSGYNLDYLLNGLHQLGFEVPAFRGERAPKAPRFEGFSLIPLFVGSEGSLGVITKAGLKLVKKPKERHLLLSFYPDLNSALEDNRRLVRFEGVAAVELLDRMVLDLARLQSGLKDYMEPFREEAKAVLLIEVSGSDERELEGFVEAIQKELFRNRRVTVLKSSESQQRVWKVRKAGLPLLLGMKGKLKPIAFIEDTAVSPDRLPEFVARFQEIVASHQTRAAFYAHASVGCLHIRPLLDLKNKEDLEKMRSISLQVAHLVLEFEGSLSGEHGDGRARSYHNRLLFGDLVYGVLEEIKTLFDPFPLLNPSMIVQGADPLQDLRYDPETAQEVPKELGYNWSPESYIEAVELCNGAGVCRKPQLDQTMCPSFHVTREERETPRARANLMRGLLQGRLPESYWNSRESWKTFQNCVGCKGCKNDCPSSVDVAKLKGSFLYQWYQRKRPSLRVRSVARMGQMAPLLSPYAKTINHFVESSLGRLVTGWLGFAKERSLPRWAQNNFWSKIVHERQKGDLGKVLLFVDTFHGYFEPQVAYSAQSVLQRLGWEVFVAPQVCCGRTALSKGFLELAKKQAQHWCEVMLAHESEVDWIVGLEPSCILSVLDEYNDLVQDLELPRLQRKVLTFEQLLAKVDPSFLRSRLGVREGVRSLSVHGHCHHKALVGKEALRESVAKNFAGSVTVLDTGCCGMAGSFGYESENYEMSQLMGEVRLFPEVAKLHPLEDIVIASGFSCRHQLKERFQRPIYHVAQWLDGVEISDG